MSRRRKIIVVGALIAVEVLICVVSIALLATSRFPFSGARFFYVADTRAEETIEERFAADGPPRLDLSNAYGDVQIAAGDSEGFVVKAIKEAWGQDQREAEARLKAIKIKMTMDGGTLQVEVEDPDSQTAFVFGAVRASQVRFEIAVPRQTAVTVHTRHGEVNLQGTAGDADLTSQYGDVTVKDVSGSVKADTNNGQVAVLRAGGEGATIGLHSHYGDVTARQLTASELTLDSNNGKLNLEDAAVHGDLTLNSQYGRVDLDSVRASSLTVKTQNGTVNLRDSQVEGTLDLYSHYGAVSVARTRASDYQIETNNGAIELDGAGGPLWLHSRYGDIEIRGAYDATLDLNTNNGKVTFEGSLSAETSHKVESNYGTVTLRLPQDTAIFLEANTDYGRIRCDFDVLVKGGNDEKEERRGSGDELRGTINDGSESLRVKTHNGDVIIEVEPSK